MAIEFNGCVVGGRNYVAATVDNTTLCLLEKDGSAIRIMGATILYVQLEQILSKMKELQGENK